MEFSSRFLVTFNDDTQYGKNLQLVGDLHSHRESPCNLDDKSGPPEARRLDKIKRLRERSKRVGRTEKSPEPNARWIPGLLVSDSLKLKIRCARAAHEVLWED